MADTQSKKKSKANMPFGIPMSAKSIGSLLGSGIREALVLTVALLVISFAIKPALNRFVPQLAAGVTL